MMPLYSSRTLFPIILIFCALLICLMGACGKDDKNPDGKFDLISSIDHDGKERTYRVHLPPTYYQSANSLPVVLALHGGGGSGEQFERQSQLNQKSDAENFVVVYPDGLTNPNVSVRTWNAGKCCGANASVINTDDVGFISKLIDRLHTDFRTDPKRVYITGHSNGAMLSFRLADELSAKIAAIAPNAGNFQMKNEFDPVRNVPVLAIISKLDKNVIYTGGMTNGPGGQYNPPLDSCLNSVASLATCGQSKQVIETFPLYSVYKWSDCIPSDFEVVLFLTEDGGHSWPGGNKGSIIGDEPSKAFSNNDIIWDFFKKHSLK